MHVRSCLGLQEEPQRKKGPNKKKKQQKPHKKTQETHKTSTKATQQHENNTECVWDLWPHYCKPVVSSSTKIGYPLCARRGGKLTVNKKKLMPSNSTQNTAFIVCPGTKCRCLLRWNTCLANRNLKESAFCTDKNQRCGDSKSGPEKHRLATM